MADGSNQHILIAGEEEGGLPLDLFKEINDRTDGAKETP